MMNFWIILVPTTLLIEAIHGMDISLCLESTQGQYPYPGDCTKYIQCNNGQAAILNCGSGSSFNPETHQCDFSYVKQDCHHPAYSQETLKMFCKNVISGPIPHPFDCSKFIECSSAMSTIKNCSAGLVYNLAVKVCDWPRSVKGCVGNSGHGVEHRKDITLVPLDSGENRPNQLGDEESNAEDQGHSLDPVQRSARSTNHQVNEDSDDEEECEEEDLL